MFRPHAHISLSRLCSLIVLAALESDAIVPSQLVSSVYPTHVPVVECNTLRPGDIMNCAISSLPTYSGGGKWRGIRSHHVDQLGVTPYNDGDLTTQTELELTRWRSAVRVQYYNRYNITCKMCVCEAFESWWLYMSITCIITHFIIMYIFIVYLHLSSTLDYSNPSHTHALTNLAW